MSSNDKSSLLRNDENEIELPVSSSDEGEWGSDVAALNDASFGHSLRDAQSRASFRGLHDSLVNKLGNRQPQMLLCLHEESAVAIAHVGEGNREAAFIDCPFERRPHACDNGGIQCWCDRMPLLYSVQRPDG